MACTNAQPSASESISRLLEATVTAMGNLAVNNPVVQSRVVTNGTLSLLSRLLAGLFLDLSFLEAGGGEVLCKRTRSEGKEDEEGEGEEETTERKGV